MRSRIAFHDGGFFDVGKSYEDVNGLHCRALAAGQPYEVDLLDGTHGLAGTVVRLMVNPASVAYIQELVP